MHCGSMSILDHDSQSQSISDLNDNISITEPVSKTQKKRCNNSEICLKSFKIYYQLCTKKIKNIQVVSL